MKRAVVYAVGLFRRRPIQPNKSYNVSDARKRRMRSGSPQAPIRELCIRIYVKTFHIQAAPACSPELRRCSAPHNVGMLCQIVMHAGCRLRS
jgi:hypothetical protein